MNGSREQKIKKVGRKWKTSSQLQQQLRPAQDTSEEAKHLAEYDTRHDMMQSGRFLILNSANDYQSCMKVRLMRSRACHTFLPSFKFLTLTCCTESEDSPWRPNPVEFVSAKACVFSVLFSIYVTAHCRQQCPSTRHNSLNRFFFAGL